MMNNFAFELADHQAEQERAAGISAASGALKRAGAFECAACGSEISLARRRAYPAASRCIGCQAEHEQRGKRR